MTSIDTVSDLPSRYQYVAAPAQTAFPYPAPFFDDGDLVVVVDGVTAPDTDYTVDGEGEDLGGNVTFLSPFVGGEIVTLYRDIAIARDTDISQNGPWSSDVYNNEQDKIFLLLQQLKTQLARSLRIPIIADVDDADIELEVANFANMYLTFDANGKPTPAVLSATTLTQAAIGVLFYPRTAREVSVGVTPTYYYYAAYNILRYGVVADGVTDNSTEVNNWLQSIPSDGTGLVPATASAICFSSSLTRASRCSTIGEGRGSCLKHTGSGVGITFSDGRFQTHEKWLLLGTVAGTGGFWVKNAYELFATNQLFVEGYTGANAYCFRYSDCWDVNMQAGCARQSTIGILADATDLGQGGIVNVFNINGVDCSDTGTGIDYQAGILANISNCDFTNSGGTVTAVCAIEVGRGLSGTDFVDTVNITGCWFEGLGASVRVGRNNTSSATPSRVVIENNYMGATGVKVELFKGNRCEIGENLWGASAGVDIRIAAGVTRTLIRARDYSGTLVDNSTAGQTYYLQYDSILTDSITARGSMSSGKDRLLVHKNGVDQTITTGTITVISFGTEVVDTNAAFTSNAWTPAKAGDYILHGQATVNTAVAGNLIQLTIYKNGTRHKLTNHYVAANGNATVSVTAYLAAVTAGTDVFTLRIEHNKGADASVEGDADSTYLEAWPVI